MNENDVELKYSLHVRIWAETEREIRIHRLKWHIERERGNDTEKKKCNPTFLSESALKSDFQNGNWCFYCICRNDDSIVLATACRKFEIEIQGLCNINSIDTKLRGNRKCAIRQANKS